MEHYSESSMTSQLTSNYSTTFNSTSMDGSTLGSTTTLPSFKTTIPSSNSLDFTWVEYVGMVLSLIIFTVGMAGNILTIIIMRRKPFLASSACVYLPCMAIFDSIFLVSGIPFEWVSWFQIDIESWACRFHRFIFYGSGDVSVWILVAFTFDRFIAVCFPFKKRFFCEPRKALITVCLCIFLGVLKNAHLFWTRGIEMKKGQIIRSCGQVEEYRTFEKYVRPWIAFVFVSLIPFISIIVFNASIVHNLLKSKKSRPDAFSGRRSTVMSNKSSIYSGRDTIRSKEESGQTKKNSGRSVYQTTAMCLSVSFAFLIFIAPSIVIHIGKPYWKKNPFYDAVKTINNMLFYANHGINFYLYCLTGVRFRAELQVLFGKREKRSYSIMSGLNPRFASTRPSILTSEAKESTVSSDHNDSQGFADAAIALALRRELASDETKQTTE